MIAVFLLVGVPVYRLTRPASPTSVEGAHPTEAATDDAVAKTAPVEIEVVCASSPADFQIKCLDQIVLAGQAPQARFTKLWTVAIPPEGTDLVVRARWPTSGTGNVPATDTPSGANPAAARVTVRLADGRQIEKSFWAGANGTLNEVFTVPGAPADATP